MAGTVSVEGDSDYVKIFIDGTLHIHFLKKTYLGLSSFHENIYSIEILLGSNSLVTEYDDRDLWEDVLDNLNEVL